MTSVAYANCAAAIYMQVIEAERGRYAISYSELMQRDACEEATTLMLTHSKFHMRLMSMRTVLHSAIHMLCKVRNQRKH